MQVNRISGVVERYVGEVNGKDTWETLYDPVKDGMGVLEFLLSEIKREERSRFAFKLQRFMDEIL